jgi:hypothetical protein
MGNDARLAEALNQFELLWGDRIRAAYGQRDDTVRYPRLLFRGVLEHDVQIGRNLWCL